MARRELFSALFLYRMLIVPLSAMLWRFPHPGMSTHGWWWALDAELATALVAEGFHVISIDNRDVGKSHK